MKRLNKYGVGTILLAASCTLTGCIEETFPTQNAVIDQVGSSETAIEATLMGIPAQLNRNIFSTRRDWDYGYSSIMHVRDIMTQDMATANDQMYNQYSAWGQNVAQGVDYAYAQFLWTAQTKYVNAANQLVMAVDTTTATDEILGYLGAALAYRAMFYLDMAREYEFLSNDAVSSVNSQGQDVMGLTVPIVDENTSIEDSRNNSRATRDEMAAFIEGDLKKAEKYVVNLSLSNKSLPHIDCVYGLYARLYMWTGDYEKAATYARLAIDNATAGVMTRNAALSTTTGFNDASQWMWGVSITQESMVSNLANWISYASCETLWGYSTPAAGSEIMIDRSMYDRLSNTDWRKLMWKAPAGSALDGQNTYCDAALGAELKDYCSLKFRPAGGNISDYSVGGEVSYPLMRVEEMYFIEAEAVAHQDPARGRQLLEQFMTANRDEQYRCTVSTTDAVVEEIAFQKRIELWGEGQAFFDIKRLNLPCTRSYDGSNHLPEEAFNTTGRAAWMNWVIDYYEQIGNYEISEYNNPDPSDAYDPIPFN